MSNPLDLLDVRVKEMTALFPLRDETGRLVWLIKCDCGTEFCLPANQFVGGGWTSCGCRKDRTGRNNPTWKGHGDISGQWWGQIRKCAEYRSIPFDITVNDAWAQFEKQGGRCALTGVTLTMNDHSKAYATLQKSGSLDRIDSSKGYTRENIQWVHKRINKMKQDIHDIEFIEWCRKVVDYNG